MMCDRCCGKLLYWSRTFQFFLLLSYLARVHTPLIHPYHLFTLLRFALLSSILSVCLSSFSPFLIASPCSFSFLSRASRCCAIAAFYVTHKVPESASCIASKQTNKQTDQIENWTEVMCDVRTLWWQWLRRRQRHQQNQHHRPATITTSTATKTTAAMANTNTHCIVANICMFIMIAHNGLGYYIFLLIIQNILYTQRK